MSVYRGPEGLNEFEEDDDIGLIKDAELTAEDRIALDGFLKSRRYIGGRTMNPDPRESLTGRDAAKLTYEREAATIAERLAELQVSGVRTAQGEDRFTWRDVSRYPDLGELPTLVDEIHWQVYVAKKGKSPSPYISVTLEDILGYVASMRETEAVSVNLAKKQTEAATTYFLNRMAVDSDSYYLALSTPEGRHMARSLHRLLQERAMQPFTRTFEKAVRNRMDEPPVDFITFAARTIRAFDRRYRSVLELGQPFEVPAEASWRSEFAIKPDEPDGPATPKIFRPVEGADTELVTLPESRPQELDLSDPDQQMWFQLRMREMDRTRAFAMPIAEYLERELAKRQS